MVQFKKTNSSGRINNLLFPRASSECPSQVECWLHCAILNRFRHLSSECSYRNVYIPSNLKLLFFGHGIGWICWYFVIQKDTFRLFDGRRKRQPLSLFVAHWVSALKSPAVMNAGILIHALLALNSLLGISTTCWLTKF